MGCKGMLNSYMIILKDNYTFRSECHNTLQAVYISIYKHSNRRKNCFRKYFHCLAVRKAEQWCANNQYKCYQSESIIRLDYRSSANDPVTSSLWNAREEVQSRGS